MDTAKPLNPSSKAEAADDLIEELARLMADDAQLKTPAASAKGPGAGSTPDSAGGAPKPAGSETGSATVGQPSGQGTTPGADVPRSPSSPQGAGQPGAAAGQGGFGSAQTPPASPSAAPPVRSFAAPTPPPGKSAGAQGGAKPAFDFSKFNLNTPRTGASNAGASSLNTPAQTPAAPAAGAPPASFGDDSPQGTSSDSAFDFGFGAGSGGTGSSGQDSAGNAEQHTPPAQSSDPLLNQPASDPIADLINAAVSKHKEPAPKPAQAPVPPVTPSGGAGTPEAKGTDNFTTSPVFGVPGTPSSPAAAPQVTPDKPGRDSGSSALDEIEALIGNSVQVDSTQAQPVQPGSDAVGLDTQKSADSAPADLHAQQAVEGPAFRSATSGNLSENLAAEFEQTRDGGEDVKGADSTIMQAMAAAGTATTQARGAGSAAAPELRERNLVADDSPLAALSRDDSGLEADADQQDFVPLRERSLNLKRYVVPAVGVLFIAAIGLGAYTLLNSGSAETDAPVLQADGAPVREVPPPTAQGETRSVVLNEIDGVSPPVGNEQLVSRDETQGETPTTIRQVIAGDTSETGLANRRVRTVTVRPDGTIVSGDAAVAGGEVLPVAQPNLPELPSEAINTELASTTVAALPATPDLLSGTSGSNPLVPTTSLVSTADPNVPFPRERLTNRAELAARAASSGSQALPASTLPRGNNSLAVNLLADNASAATSGSSSQAATPPASSTAPAQPAPAAAGALVQLASQRSEAVANETAATMQARYSAALNGRSLIVRRVDLGARGIYYRVQLPTASLAEANSVCNAIKAAGGDCFTRNS